MQTIRFEADRTPLLDDIERLFAWASVKRPSSAVDCTPAMQPAVDALAAAGGLDRCLCLRGAAPQAPATALDPGKAVVVFSGGKDSLAAALKLREQGRRVALVYCQGINGAAYGREAVSAAAVAAAAGFPLRIIPARLSGKSEHIENPAKNLALTGLGVAFALRHGCGLVALGALEHDGENAKNWSCGISDDPALIEAGAVALRALAPGIEIRPALHASDADSMATVFRLAPEVIPSIGSCMLGPRAHGSTRAANERKFCLQLMPGRCGSCYKCAFETIALAALRSAQLAPALATHCIDKLRAGLKTIRGTEKTPSAADALGAFFEPPVAAVDWRRALGLPADYRAAA